jgi:hypothetical protein
MADIDLNQIHANTTPFSAYIPKTRTTIEDRTQPQNAPNQHATVPDTLIVRGRGSNSDEHRDDDEERTVENSLWEQTHVDLLLTWKGQAFVHLWTQAASMYLYRRLYTLFSFPILIISTITGTIVYADSRLTKYVISALSLIMAILSSLQRQIRPSERAAEHLAIVQKYNVIIRNINTTICLPEDQRPDPGIFIQNIKQQLDNIANSQPEPLEIVITFFNRRFKVSVEKALYGDSLQELLDRDNKINEALSKMTLTKGATSWFLNRMSRVAPVRDIERDVGRTFFYEPGASKAVGRVRVMNAGPAEV